jgi:hypothetical protein
MELEGHRFLLYPSLDEARRRNRVRSPGEEGDMIDSAIPWIYGIYAPRLEGMRAAGWHIVETTGLDVDAVVALIRKQSGG